MDEVVEISGFSPQLIGKRYQRPSNASSKQMMRDIGGACTACLKDFSSTREGFRPYGSLNKTRRCERCPKFDDLLVYLSRRTALRATVA